MIYFSSDDDASKGSRSFRMMPRHILRRGSALLLSLLILLFAGCKAARHGDEALEQLYRQAEGFARQEQYLKALECYNKALSLDTLRPASPGFVKALYEKRSIEGLSGEYTEAFRSTARLEKLPASALSPSQRNSLLVDKALWLREVGRFSEAAASLERVVAPSPELRFELATLYQQSGEYQKAATIYRSFIELEHDPMQRITAYGGLLQCKVARPELGGEEADAIAAKIAQESGRVFAIKGELKPKIQALRAAARSLQLLEKHKRNASYLLFRALILAQESGDPFLLQMLRLESNGVIVRKADTSTEVAEYFRINKLQYGEAVAQLMLARSHSLKSEEQVKALQHAFALLRSYTPPSPPADYLQLEKNGGRQLTAILLEQSRIFDLFDAGEQIALPALGRALLRNRGMLRLAKGHEALEAELASVQQDIAGLLQRKADIVLRAEGYSQNKVADQALNRKRGRLVELLDELRPLNPVAAAALQLTPVTLRTLQVAMQEGQLIVKPLLSDSLAGVMLISKKELQITRAPLCFDRQHTPDSALGTLRRELAAPSFNQSAPGVEQEWLSRALYAPLESELVRYRHIVVIMDDLFPYHILRNNHAAGDEQRLSYLHSMKEFMLLSEKGRPDSVQSNTLFYPVDSSGEARIHKLFFPRDRLFLLWKQCSGPELEALRREINEGAAGGTAGTGEWRVSCSLYGVD